jgi:helix-turn-helix protein
MNNPFETIDARLSNIENILLDLKHTPKETGNESEDKTLLRRKDVSKLFTVSLVTINKWMRSGKLPYHRINSRIYFKKNEVIEAMQSPQKHKRSNK